MSRRVLIVVSSYAPAMIADMHRARHLAWELPQMGWEVEILAPDRQFQTGAFLDRDSEGFFAPDTKVHFVRPLWGGIFGLLGMGSIGWRALVPMLFRGSRLLRGRRFSIVFLSTTQFPLFLLGPLWRALGRTPYVLDFHDPCYREGVKWPVWAKPTIKHRVAHRLLQWVERTAVRSADAIVAVSPVYLGELAARYRRRSLPWMAEGRTAAIPFGVRPGDFDEARRLVPEGGLHIGAGTESRTIAYVGAGGTIMQRSFRLLCETLASLRDRNLELLTGVMFDLRGTDLAWKPGDRKHLADVARDAGVSGWVEESPGRVTYRESLEHLLRSDGAIVLGVEDDGYIPSKLFSYAWSGKPLLAVLRRDGPAYDLFRRNPALGHALWFDAEDAMPMAEAFPIVKAFLEEVRERKAHARASNLAPYLAGSMARRHAELFLGCEDGSRTPSVASSTAQ